MDWNASQQLEKYFESFSLIWQKNSTKYMYLFLKTSPGKVNDIIHVRNCQSFENNLAFFFLRKLLEVMKLAKKLKYFSTKNKIILEKNVNLCCTTLHFIDKLPLSRKLIRSQTGRQETARKNIQRPLSFFVSCSCRKKASRESRWRLN